MQNTEDTKAPIEESTEHETTQPHLEDHAPQEQQGTPEVFSDLDVAEETPYAFDADVTSPEEFSRESQALEDETPDLIDDRSDVSAESTQRPKTRKATGKDASPASSARPTKKSTSNTTDGDANTSIVRVRSSSRSLVKPASRTTSKAIARRPSKPKVNGPKAAPARKRRPNAKAPKDAARKAAPKPTGKRVKRQQANSSAQAKPSAPFFALFKEGQKLKGKPTANGASQRKGAKPTAKHFALPKPLEPERIASAAQSFFQDHREWPGIAKEKALRAVDWAQANAGTAKTVAPVVIVVVYIVASLFFMFHYLPGTTINRDNVTLRSANTATSIAKEKVEGYSLKVSGDGLDFSVQTADVNLSLDEEAFRKEAATHLPGWLWPFILFTNREYQVTGGISYNKDKVDGMVSSAVETVNEKATAPQDANISYDKKKSSFVAVSEKGGTAINKDAAIAVVDQGVSTLLDNVELGNDELQQPRLYASAPEMNDAIKHANSLMDIKLPLLVNMKTIETIDKNLLQSWITLDGSYEPQGDLETITAWAKKDLSAAVDTVGTMRSFTRPNDGKRIEVYGGGTYGWNMDGAGLSKIICERLKDKSDEPIEVPMLSKVEVYEHGTQDWGPRFVDVDLGEQYVRMFDEDSNIIMQSECVSGNMAEGNDTVTGVFYLEDKQSPALLVGLDNDGDGLPDYENEVQFWMPFYGGYGLHDALWRDYFGGDTFQYDGSHGCVNLPYYAAEILYDIIKVGDTVVVHW